MVRFLSESPQEGIVVEVGVWQGGSIRYLAERFPTRRFFGFDTFEGMPAECAYDNHHKKGDFGDTSFELAKSNLADLTNVQLIQGYFPDSDVGILSDPIVLAHVDVDIYESTLRAFEHLSPMMASGGRIYCDDAFIGTCHGATIAFCEFCGRLKRAPHFDPGSHATVCF